MSRRGNICGAVTGGILAVGLANGVQRGSTREDVRGLREETQAALDRLTGATEQKLEAFLSRLAREGVSASTQNQAFNALLFFYREVLKQELGPVNSLRAKQPANPRHCPSQEDVRRLLGAVADIYGYPTRLIVHVLYGCGLRVTEPLNLRIKDVDFKESKFYVYQAKGGKGRVVLFPNCLTGPLQQQMAVAKHIAEQDHARGIPVPLPGLLAKKYPSAARSERWAWFFPSHTLCRDPRSGAVVRWRCHESS